MKRKQFSEEQIISILKEAEAGARTVQCVASWAGAFSVSAMTFSEVAREIWKAGMSGLPA